MIQKLKQRQIDAGIHAVLTSSGAVLLSWIMLKDIWKAPFTMGSFMWTLIALHVIGSMIWAEASAFRQDHQDERAEHLTYRAGYLTKQLCQAACLILLGAELYIKQSVDGSLIIMTFVLTFSEVLFRRFLGIEHSKTEGEKKWNRTVRNVLIFATLSMSAILTIQLYRFLSPLTATFGIGWLGLFKIITGNYTP